MALPIIEVGKSAVGIEYDINVLGDIAFIPEHFGAIGDCTAVGVGTDDTVALRDAITAAAAVNGKVLLGPRSYRVSGNIADKLTNPVAIIGAGKAQTKIVVDASFTGDVMSFSNCWYGVEKIIDNTGAVITGNPIVGYLRETNLSRKSGIYLEGFTITGTRNAVDYQNGIMFYNRTDALTMRDVEVEFLKGTGFGLAGYASNPATNAAAHMRESYIENCQARWCGDWATARPSVVICNTSKTLAQVGGIAANITDDGNNYNFIKGLKVTFSEGMSIQASDFNLGANHQHDHRFEAIIDSQRGPASNPTYISGGSINSANWSVTSGVLTISSGGTFTRNTGTGNGDIVVGLYVYHASVPPGTYISSLISGPGAAGAGSYQLANRYIDVSGLTIASGQGSCRFTVPCMEIGGGHNAEQWDLTFNGSNTLNSNSVQIVFTTNPFHTNTPKTTKSKLVMASGSADLGLLLVSITSLSVDLTSGFGTAVPITIGVITQSVTVDAGYVFSGKSSEMQINGGASNLHVYPGNQAVVEGATIDAVMTASKWPNCSIILNNSGTYTRHLSNGSTWVAL